MTYYAYLKDRVAAASLSSRAQLEQMIDAERNAFWQMLIQNPAYDERARMGALAQFDEAAGQILSEGERRFGAGPAAVRTGKGKPAGIQARGAEPKARRSWLRDLLFLLVGIAIGLAFAYFGGGLFEASLRSSGLANGSRVPQLVASVSSYKFGRSSPESQREGEISVKYARGAADPAKCEVEATYNQLLEYVRFDQACTTISYKFLPVADLIQNFNYLQGYMVFTTTITSAAGAWKGTASVYFSIDASA